MVTHLAIKTDKIDKVLEIFNKYFEDNYNLGIGEIRIAGKETPFTKGKNNYKDWRDYSDRIGLIRSDNNIDINTDFDLFFNLNDNKDWIIFLFYPHRGYRGYFKYVDFIKVGEVIAKEIQCSVISHTHNDSTGYTHIHHFQNGTLIDEMELDERDILVKKGYFEEFDDSIYEDIREYESKIYFPFLDKYSFYPDSEDFETTATDSVRGFYLDGEMDNLKKYLGRLVS